MYSHANQVNLKLNQHHCSKADGLYILVKVYLYKVERLKLRLMNFATCSSARHKMGIKATAVKIHIDSSQYSAAKNLKIFRGRGTLTFKAKMWSDKCKAVDKVDKIFGCNYWLKIDLNSLQIPCPWSLRNIENRFNTRTIVY